MASCVSVYEMKRKPLWIAVLLVALALAGVSGRIHRHAAISAQSFAHYFQDLKGATSVSPVERFVFSIVLASADPYPPEQR
jgi:hypothetical protein